jgi:hypothetical protein
MEPDSLTEGDFGLVRIEERDDPRAPTITVIRTRMSMAEEVVAPVDR